MTTTTTAKPTANKINNSRTSSNKISNSSNNNNSNRIKTQQQHLYLIWSNFKPEFSGKCICFAQMIGRCTLLCQWCKGQRFCITLLGEARLHYHSLEPINIDWPNCKICLGKDIQRWVTCGETVISHLEVF